MPNFSSSGFANASSYSKFVKLLQDISMTSQFHRKNFAVLVWQIIWSQSCDCLFWESFSPLCNICYIFTFSNISENQSWKRFREIRQQPCAIKKHPVLDSSKQGLLLWSSWMHYVSTPYMNCFSIKQFNSDLLAE